MNTNVRRHCVFCGAAADSREHVFAKRLCKRAGAVKFKVIAGLSVEGETKAVRETHEIESVQVRHVCKGCNNNWMNDLEAWFEKRLGFLIEPQWPKLALSMIETLKTEREQLAKWLLKSAVMFNLASLQGEHRVKFAPEMIRGIKEGIIPKNCWVDLAYAKMPTVGGTITRCFRVINGGIYNPSQIVEDGGSFKFYVQFNHLLLRIGQAPNANVTYQSWQGEFPVRLYPKPAPKTPDKFTYEDIMKFEHAVILETWLGCRGNIR
jgi:hypothetical protein